MSEKEKLITAYHEGGHALVAAALPGTDPVHKVTILPRGRALGYTMVLPDEDKYSQTRSEMLDKLAYMLGGRAAEELVFHDPTTGAGNDIEKATSLARAMVTQYGMTERLGAIKLGDSNSEPFLGRDMGHQRDYSEEVAAVVDEEVKTLLDTAHQEAFDILEENRDVLDALVARAAREGDARQGADRPDLRAAAAAAARARPGPARRTATRPRSRPVEIPEQIRERRPQRQRHRRPTRPRAASSVTPPGAGGDTHGDTVRRHRHHAAARPPTSLTGHAMTDPISLDERDAARLRPRPRRGGGARAAARDRGGPRPRGPAGHPGAGGAGVRRADRRACGSAPRTC